MEFWRTAITASLWYSESVSEIYLDDTSEYLDIVIPSTLFKSVFSSEFSELYFDVIIIKCIFNLNF